MKKQVEYLRWVDNPPKIGERCVLVLTRGETVNISRIIAIGDNFIETKNTLYILHVSDESVNDNSGRLSSPDWNTVDSQPVPTNNQVNNPQKPHLKINTPNKTLKDQIIQQTAIQDNQYGDPRVFQNREAEKPQSTQQTYVSDKVGLNKADYETRLKVAKKLKIIKDVDSDKPGT